MSTRIGKSLVVDGETIVSQQAWSDELDAKHERLVAWLKLSNLDGVLLKRNENVAWLTGGAVEVRVLTPNETGVASLLVTAEGERHYFTTNNEAPRLEEEEFGQLDFKPVIFPWYADDTDQSAMELAKGKVACDVPSMGFAHAHMAPLRASLEGSEIARFRWLGKHCGEAVTEVLTGLRPGVSDYEVEGRVAHALLSRGILPSVYLMATDDRIVSYKHAVARGGVIDKFAMINLCARKWGLTASITRFAYFGPVPGELAEKFRAAAQVNAALLDATRVGATGGELFKTAVDAYAAAGFAGEEQLHHQGGATGYWEREWVATPDGKEAVVDGQVFAWNPSVRGGKVEDTVLLRGGAIELLTPTPGLPGLASSCQGTDYPASGVLEL